MKYINLNKIRMLLASILFIFLLPVFSEEDSYHQYLRDQLKNSFNIEGGPRVLSDPENTTNKLTALTNVTNKTESYSGKKPFTEVVRFTAAKMGTNPWDNAVRYNTKVDIKKNDALLLYRAATIKCLTLLCFKAVFTFINYRLTNLPNPPKCY